MKNKTVILVGCGHAHLEVLKAFTKDEVSSQNFILISPHRQTYYSGLIPRLIAGEIDVPKLTISAADFAERKGFRFIQDSIRSIDQTENSILLESGKTKYFDILSVNIGGTPQKIPTESPFNTVYLRPFDEFISRWQEVQRICSACANPRFVVVGGGAAAVEVASALRIRLDRNQARKSEVHLVTKGSRLCEGYSKKISASILKFTIKEGIQVHLNEQVSEIFEKHIKLSSGRKLVFDSVFIVTPTEPAEILSRKVDSSLRLAPNIFAVGDCTIMKDYPDLPRSGVIAVHQGRHLAKSIRAVLNGEMLPEFSPRKHFLNILRLSDESARLIRGRQSFEGKLALQIKNWIDDRYMKSFDFSVPDPSLIKRKH